MLDPFNARRHPAAVGLPRRVLGRRRRLGRRVAAGMYVEPLEARRLLAADAAASFAFAAHNAVDVVVIDSALVASIPQEELASSLVVAIDNSRDAIDQITTALAGLTDVDTLRVISHGSDGRLWFGDQAIDAATLAARAIDVSAWSRSLSADADILLYGCSVASTLDGRRFVEQLGSLTQPAPTSRAPPATRRSSSGSEPWIAACSPPRPPTSRPASRSMPRHETRGSRTGPTTWTARRRSR
jgi:hypothetical protein